MSYEMVVGLQIKDDKMYSKYREAMTPLLKEHGGGFRYDFKIDQVLKNAEDRPINRVFTIHFKNKEMMNTFFSSERYKIIRESYFDQSVAEKTIISEYEIKI